MRSTKLKKQLSQSYNNTTLANALDNAAQTVLLPLLPTHKSAKDYLRAHFPDASIDIDQTFTLLTGFHQQIISATGPVRKRPFDIDLNSIQQAYSIIYHLLPEPDDGRIAIQASFKALAITLLSKEESVSFLPILTASLQPKRGKL